jgi:hypothetical protein
VNLLRRQIATLRRQLKRLIVELGMRGWISPRQASTALKTLRLADE